MLAHETGGQPLPNPSGVNPLSTVKDESGGAAARPILPAVVRNKIKREPMGIFLFFSNLFISVCDVLNFEC